MEDRPGEDQGRQVSAEGGRVRVRRGSSNRGREGRGDIRRGSTLFARLAGHVGAAAHPTAVIILYSRLTNHKQSFTAGYTSKYFGCPDCKLAVDKFQQIFALNGGYFRT